MSYIALTADQSRVRKVRKRLRRKGYAAYVPCIVTKRVIPKGGKLSRKRRIVPLRRLFCSDALTAPDAVSVAERS